MTDLTHLLLALRAQIVDSEGPIKIGPWTVEPHLSGSWCATRGCLTAAISPTRLGSASLILAELVSLSGVDSDPCPCCGEQPTIQGRHICLPCELRPIP